MGCGPGCGQCTNGRLHYQNRVSIYETQLRVTLGGSASDGVFVDASIEHIGVGGYPRRIVLRSRCEHPGRLPPRLRSASRMRGSSCDRPRYVAICGWLTPASSEVQTVFCRCSFKTSNSVASPKRRKVSIMPSIAPGKRHARPHHGTAAEVADLRVEACGDPDPA